MRHLPDERDWDHMDRKWLTDILYTVDKSNFEKMVKAAVKARQERLEDKNNLNVSMRPEFAQAFENCMNFSCKNYILYHDACSGKRKGDSSDEIVF